MKVFKLSPDGFEPIRRRTWNVIFPFFIGTVLFASTVVGIVQLSDRKNKTPALAIIVIDMIALLLVLGVGFFAMKRGLKRREEGWLSYELCVDEDKVVRKQSGLPDQELKRREIRRMRQLPDGSLCIIPSNQFQTLIVPGDLQGLQELKARLADWTPIEVSAQHVQRVQAIQIVISLSLIAAFFGGSFLGQKWLSIPSGAILCAFMLWIVISAIFTPNLDSRTRRNQLIWIFPFLSILTGLYFAWRS